MAWEMSGNLFEFCTCKAMCPCWLGPSTQPDEGWCSGVLAFEVQQGSIDTVDVSGCMAVLAADWPGNFFGGHGMGRLYIDARSDDQRRELEAVFSGRKGGVPEGLMAAVIERWLPARFERIVVHHGEPLTLSVGSVGKATLTPFRDRAGRTATVENTAAQEVLRSESMALASSAGTRWSDPDLREWSGDSATVHRFNWSA